jgi:hypothetical protein
MVSRSSTALSYVPFHLLGDKPNVIVDGIGNAKTRLTLSHWPGNKTPSQFKADLSAEIVFNFIDHGEMPADVEAVSNNHFDEDGLVSLFAILNPEEACQNREFLIDVARAGDFARFEDRDAARVSWVISAWTDPDRSPLNRTIFSGTHDQLSAVLFEELLQRLPAIVDKIGHFETFWSAEDKFLDLTEDAIEKGLIEISEDSDADLAVVVIPDGGILGQGRPPAHAASWISSVCHPMAIHNRVDSHRVLVIHKRHFSFYYRYETWVDFVSKNLPPRIDLSAFARRLNELERGATHWQFSGVNDIIGRLTMREGSDSRLSPNEIVKLLTTELRS